MRRAGFIIIVLLLAGLAALMLFAPWQGDPFERSALGAKGLELWLDGKGVPVVHSDPHISRSPDELSLRILPLHEDFNFRAEGDDVDEADDRLDPTMLDNKLYELSSLVIMPKWRGDLLEEGIARQDMLIPVDTVTKILAQIYLADLRMVRLGPEFQQADLSLVPGRSETIALYRAQLFDRASLSNICTEIAGLPAGAFIIRCNDAYGATFLSDPDLLNNHGLSRGENAAVALSLVSLLRGPDDSRPVYLDTSAGLLDGESSDTEGRTYERSASDLQRFFDFPLTAIWGAVLLLTLIAFWRGAYRFGPPLDPAASGLEISKTVAVEATARLLRLSGNDGRMVAQFTQNLLADKAARVFGPSAANPAGVERLFQRLARRNAEQASALRAVTDALIERGPELRRASLHRHLETFRKLLKEIDLGSE